MIEFASAHIGAEDYYILCKSLDRGMHLAYNCILRSKKRQLGVWPPQLFNRCVSTSLRHDVAVQRGIQGGANVIAHISLVIETIAAFIVRYSHLSDGLSYNQSTSPPRRCRGKTE